MKSIFWIIIFVFISLRSVQGGEGEVTTFLQYEKDSPIVLHLSYHGGITEWDAGCDVPITGFGTTYSFSTTCGFGGPPGPLALEEIPARAAVPPEEVTALTRATDAATTNLASSGGGIPERRRAVRRAYRRPIAAFRSRTPPVLSLTARDLSSIGVGLDVSSEVELGERLHVGLEPRIDADPLLVWGSVARIAGSEQAPAGMAVVFEPSAPEVQRRLQALLEQLPDIDVIAQCRDTATY